jgi:hypothetical protein
MSPASASFWHVYGTDGRVCMTLRLLGASMMSVTAVHLGCRHSPPFALACRVRMSLWSASWRPGCKTARLYRPAAGRSTQLDLASDRSGTRQVLPGRNTYRSGCRAREGRGVAIWHVCRWRRRTYCPLVTYQMDTRTLREQGRSRRDFRPRSPEDCSSCFPLASLVVLRFENPMSAFFGVSLVLPRRTHAIDELRAHGFSVTDWRRT